MAKMIDLPITDKRVLRNYNDIQNILIGKVFQSNWKDEIKKRIIEGLDMVVLKHKPSDSRTIGVMNYNTLILQLTNRGFNLIDETQKDIIAHEFLHLIAKLYFNKCQGHNRNFKKICTLLGYSHIGSSTYSIALDEYVEGYTPPVKPYKYRTTCSKCGTITGQHRRITNSIKHPNLYRSRCCGAKLEVEKL